MTEQRKKKSGIVRLVAALAYSLRGLADAWRNEEAFRIEATILIIATPFAFYLGRTIGETALMIGSIVFMMIVEVLNSAIEAVVDRVGTERNELSRVAKDSGSAAVFLSISFPFWVWLAFILRWLGLVTF
jgi:diacylglycerol kinase (ATP)